MFHQLGRFDGQRHRQVFGGVKLAPVAFVHKGLDRLTQLREEYQRDPQPSNRQYGWVWVEDGQEPTVPVGAIS